MKRAAAWLKLVVGGIDPKDADAVAAATSSPTPVPTEEKEIGAAYRQAAKYVRHTKISILESVGHWNNPCTGAFFYNMLYPSPQPYDSYEQGTFIPIGTEGTQAQQKSSKI